MTDPQPPDNRVDHNQQDGENNVQQNIGQVSRSTIKGRETNLHLSGIPVLIVALALVILVGFIVLVMRPDKPEEIEPTLVSEATRVPPGAQAESYLFYVDVSANMNKVIGGKQAYEWAQDVIAGIWNGIRIDPDQTRSALLKVGGGMSSACNQIEQVDFGLGSSLPVSDYLSPLNRTQPGGDSAYAEGFVNAMDYFQAPDASQSERKYLIALMGDYRGTPGCERQDRLDLPGLLERYSDTGIEVELCAFSFLSDDTQFAVWLRDQIQDYTVDCVLNIRNEADVQAASSRTVNIINNNRVQFEHTATPAPSTVTPTLTPSLRPSDTPTVTTTPPTATSTITLRPTNTPTPTLTVTAGPTITPVVCPGALPSRLQLGLSAYVNFDLGLSMRLEPSAESSQLAVLDFGDSFSIVGGPICSSGTLWWLVNLNTSTEGWVSEGLDYYFIAPTGLEQALLPNQFDDNCINELSSSLQTGDQARVLQSNLRFLRSAGNGNLGGEITPLPANTIVNILGGPVCDDNNNTLRWYIRVSEGPRAGLEGWLAEVDANNRLMVPLTTEN